MKLYERLCTAAQLEVCDITKDTLNKYGFCTDYVTVKENQDMKLPINKYQLIYDRYYNRRFIRIKY